jgi:hypothetical protein
LRGHDAIDQPESRGQLPGCDQRSAGRDYDPERYRVFRGLRCNRHAIGHDLRVANASPLQIGDVSRALGISPTAVRLLDEILLPWRTARGERLYSPERVADVARQREQAAGGRDADAVTRAAQLADHTVTGRDAMARLGVGPAALADLRRAGTLRAAKIGSKYRYSSADIDRLAKGAR